MSAPLKKIRLYSDIHNELREKNYDIPVLDGESSSILILAGDIDSDIHRLANYINDLSCRFELVIFVPGNHEYYGNDIYTYHRTIKMYITNKNVIISHLDGCNFTYNNIDFYIGTLWTAPVKKFENRINDYYKIKINSTDIFRLENHKQIYDNEQLKLRKYLRERDSDNKLVVVSHFSPSMECAHKHYNRNELSVYFNHENETIDQLIEAADYWFFGHTHYNIDMNLNGCNVISNQVGYLSEYTEYSIKHQYIEIFTN